MDIDAVDLESSQVFQDWFIEQLEREVTPEQIVDALEGVGSDTAYVRALIVSYWRSTPHYDRLLKQCLTLSNVIANEVAKGFAVYQRSVNIMMEGGAHMHARLAEMRGALDFSLRRLAQVPITDLQIEAQIGIYIPKSILHLNEQNFDEALQYASQALFLAEQIGGRVSVARARSALISCHSVAGHVETTIALAQDDRRQPFRYGWRFTELALANSLFLLGNSAEAVATVNDLIQRVDGVYQQRARSLMQQKAALWGVGGLDGEVFPTLPGEEPFGWMTEAMRELMRATALPREGRELEERASHFAQAIQICRLADDEGLRIYQWQRLFTKWVTATAHLGRGEYSAAAGALEQIGDLPGEFFDLRVLSLGAGLELALAWNAPSGASVARMEVGLRRVFAEAEERRYASGPGLARLLHRWHPTAAAYLALMPEPIGACAFAIRNVMKVGQQNVAFDDVVLPPVYACDLVLRALDFDLRRDFSFVQSDPGGSRRKKKELLQQVGEVMVWRQPISAVRIAYGLLTHQKESYHLRARSIIQSYGVRPSTAALYPMMGTLEEVDRAVRALLDGHLTPKGLAARMLEIS